MITGTSDKNMMAVLTMSRKRVNGEQLTSSHDFTQNRYRHKGEQIRIRPQRIDLLIQLKGQCVRVQIPSDDEDNDHAIPRP